VSEKIGDLVGCGRSGLALVGETLGKLATVALTLLLKLNEIMHPDATVTADSVKDDLAAIEELVEVGAAHTESFSGLTRRERAGAVDDDDLIAFADATA
jgi:hypothetical protein